MVYIITGIDGAKSGESYNIEKLSRQGKMTPDKIADFASTRAGREALDRYSDKLHKNKKHTQRIYGKQWDGVDEKGQLYKDVETNEESNIIR